MIINLPIWLLGVILLRTTLSLTTSKTVDVTTAELSRHSRAIEITRGSSSNRLFQLSSSSYETLDNDLSKAIPLARYVLGSPSSDGNGIFFVIIK